MRKKQKGEDIKQSQNVFLSLLVGQISVLYYFYGTFMQRSLMQVEQIAEPDYCPFYPENSWTDHFSGLFDVGRHVREHLRSLKRYLSRMGLITWSPEQLKSWFCQQGKRKELQNFRRKKEKNTTPKKEETKKGTSKKKIQTQPVSQAVPAQTQMKLGKKPTQMCAPSGKVPTQIKGQQQQLVNAPQHRKCKATKAGAEAVQPSYHCGACVREYKNVRSYKTHMYQKHLKIVPPGSSHDLRGQPLKTLVNQRSQIQQSQSEHPGFSPVQMPPIPEKFSDPDKQHILNLIRKDLDIKFTPADLEIVGGSAGIEAMCRDVINQFPQQQRPPTSIQKEPQGKPKLPRRRKP